MKKKQTPIPSTTDNSLEQQALSYLNSGKYKEAIGLYKKLWLDSDNDKWRQQLAYCYLQRALAFAARGMFKEALVLWDSYTQHTVLPYETYDHYISWVIQANNQDKTKLCLEQLSTEQLDKQYPKLAVLLGFLSITDHPEFQQYLPQDSVFISHLELVQTALLAYQNNKLGDVNEALKQLPYRSAFRDFRSLLNAFIVKSSSTEQARALLAKISPYSPYSQAASLIFSTTWERSELVQEVLPFNHKQQRIVAEIKGLNKKQFKFIEHLTRHDECLSDKMKFNLAIQFQSLCEPEIVQHFCQALLATYPAGRRDFNKHFAAINKFEENRFKALIFERNQNYCDAEYHWRVCVTLIKEEADNGLRIALILRHIAVNHHPDSEDHVELLIESLEHDPEDLECYLKILDYYRQTYESAEEYKQWLAKTIKKFPQDISVLTLAIKAATGNKAFKKASQYALKLLKVDPINTFAKQLLFSSYIAHARRLIKGKKYHLVENEIQQAEDLNIGKAYNIQAQLMRGVFCFIDQDKPQGLNIIVESLNKLNSDPINAHFQATMEAQLSGLPVATILRELPATKECLLSMQALGRLIQQLNEYASEDDNQVLLYKALEKIKPALKKSVLQRDIDEDLLLTLCQALNDINHFELLRHCAKRGCLIWKKPIWEYYKVYSGLNGMPERCSHANVMRLEDRREQAMHDKDHRAMVLIGSFLEYYYQAHPERTMGFLDGLFGAVEDEELDVFEDPLELLFGHIPEKILVKLDKRLESLLKKTSPEMLIQQLSKVTGDDGTIFSAMMQNPNMFTALLMLTAANDLAIDINVSVGDVLEGFGINK